MNKKYTPLLIIGAVLVAIFLLSGNSNILQKFAITSDDYVQSPTFYYYECNAASLPVESPSTILTSGSTNGWITCPSNTDECTLWISQKETTVWYSDNRRIVYQICHANGNCDKQVFLTANSFLSKKNVPSKDIPLIQGDKVWVDYQKHASITGGWELVPNGAEWYVNYKPFILWRVDMFNGGRTPYTTPDKGCNFFPADVPNLMYSVTNSVKQFNTQSTTSNVNVPFYQTRNFIGTYVPLSKENVNFVTYNGKQGYCLQRQIFAISEITTNDGVLKVVDNNFNTRLADSVTCCPGENEPTRTCNSKFTWISKETPTEGQCSALKACEGADWSESPITAATLHRYNCVDTKCIEETKKVDCTSNRDCGINEQCAMLNHTCMTIGKGIVIDNLNDTNLCDNGYTLNPATAKCEINTEPTPNYLLYAVIGAIVILIVVLATKNGGRRRR